MQAPGPLLADHRTLAMLDACAAHGMAETAVFELFFCDLPPACSLLIAASLQQPLQFLEDPRFSAEDLAWLHACGKRAPRCVDALAELGFTGDGDAVPRLCRLKWERFCCRFDDHI